MQERVRSNPKIDFLLDTVVEEFLGEARDGTRRLTAIRVRNVRSGAEQVLPADGVFIAIGHQPNTEIFRGFLEMDEQGYILTHPKSTHTNIPGVFACGDVQDRVYRQAITAAGSGCMAAIDAERWLEARRHGKD
jgi:thioredoxin reductase (NADPH)